MSENIADVLALQRFYEGMRSVPYCQQRAAVNWLAARFEADDLLRQSNPASVTGDPDNAALARQAANDGLVGLAVCYATLEDR